MARLVPFKQADVARAIKGAITGGMSVGRVEIDPQTGRIILLSPAEKATVQAPLDDWLAKHAG